MSGVVDRRNQWQIWWSVDGERHWMRLDKTQYSKRQAKREANKREAAGAVNKVHSFKVLMDEFIAYRGGAESTRYKMKKFGEGFESFLVSKGVSQDVNAITKEIVREYWKQRQKTHSPASVNVDVAFLKLVFKSFHADGFISKNPTEGIQYLKETKKVKVLPSKDEVIKILLWIQRFEPFFFAWLYFIMTRGWRRDELRKMRVEEVDLLNERLYVKHTKTGEQREERLNEQDCLVLNEHFIHLKKAGLYHPKGYLFPSQKGELICKNTLLRKVKQAAVAVGVTKNITLHLFRHYVVTSIMDATGNVEVVKAITGHKNTRTILDHYLHATPENVKRGLEITWIDTGLKVKPVSNNVSNKGD